jgi:hypothetical protein
MRTLEKYSIGVGDRFGHQAKAQLHACELAARGGIEVVPVWNKSNREHTIIGSEPASVLAAALDAVNALAWEKGWHVDADHIRVETVDRFIGSSDFFTLDVADSIGKAAPAEQVAAFMDRHPELIGRVSIPGISYAFATNRADIECIAKKFLFAVLDAGKIHRHIASAKSDFIAEISMDETDSPQTPLELLVILAAIADEEIPVQTIAPKFNGRFNKGVDYVGDLAQFEKEFEEDLAVIDFAIAQYGLPANLKLSVHSGSDKFSLYPVINRLVKKRGAGLHVKTAGTTWLEEVIGLAEAGGEGLKIAKDIYAGAFGHFDELTGPYATVIDIDKERLPDPKEVEAWPSGSFVNALRHVPGHAEYNADFRQLIHVAFKVAAKMGARYTDALKAHETIIARNVTGNLLDRHIKPIFGSVTP